MMTTPEAAFEVCPPSQLPRDGGCPTLAPNGFFDRRGWAWSSGQCQAVAHMFEVRVDSHCQDVVPFVDTATRSLRNRVTERARSVYRVAHTANPNLPYALYYGQTRLTITHSPDVLLRHLTWHINQAMIERSTVDHLVLHAAAACRAGITVALPGLAESGKTTTVAGLLREGYEYVTDEAVAVEPRTLRVIPFPKALSVDEGAWHLFPECRPRYATRTTRQWQVPAELLGSRPLRRPTPRPRLLVFPCYVEGGTTQILPMSRAEAARELTMATFSFQEASRRNLGLLADLVRDARAARLRIGSLEEAVIAIEELISITIRGGLQDV